MRNEVLDHGDGENDCDFVSVIFVTHLAYLAAFLSI